MSPMVITFIVLGIAIVCFVTDIISLGATAICVPLALYFTKVITVKEMVAGMTDSNVLMFLGMFIVGGCFLKSGLAKTIGTKIAKVMKTEMSLIIGFMIFACVLSAFLSNTGTVVTLIPIVIGTCEAKGYNPIKHLAALGLACQVGGMIALPGTPPNVTVKATIDALGTGETFGFLEFGIAGVPICIITILYVLLLGDKVLPKKTELVKKAKSDAGVVYKARDQIIVGVVFILVVISMALESVTGIPLYISSAVGAVFLMVVRIVGASEAFEEYVDWTTIIVIAGMLPLGTAMQNSGAAAMIANGAVGLLGGTSSAILYTLVIFIIGAFLTQFMSNTAATALLAPIMVSIATTIGISPKFALMALAMSASCSFATPMATPVNTVVMGYTGFSFNDFMKLGLPLIGIVGLFIVFYVPLIWA